jgi:ribonucleoside-diphosphate reductase alpha chain
MTKFNPYDITPNESRNSLLSEFGKAMLLDRYLLEGESFQDLFIRVASRYADDAKHAKRLYDYMSQLWFMPATPVLSNGGAKRGLPISCFLNEVQDSLKEIVDIWNENVWLASKGGGIGTHWGAVRSIGEKVSNSGRTSGIIPFLGVQDRLTLAISQGSLRRGSAAVYLPISHPEIEEFIEIRRPTGGDPNRKTLNLHNAVTVTDDFMKAVEEDAIWDLKSPHDDAVVSRVNARELWIRLLLARIETGEPYIVFLDTVNKHTPEIYKKNGLEVKTSNLCSEITLSTGKDQLGNNRTAVCCLSSLNLENFEKWENHPDFITDIMSFLDNVLQDFIDNAPDTMAKAKYSAARERSVGLGVMGFHSFLQSKMVPLESAIAKSWNYKIFRLIKEKVDAASKKLAETKGPCPDAKDVGIMERFAHKTAVAPTASISVIAGSASPGIEPYNSNAYTQKSLTGSFNMRNRFLQELLDKKGKNTDETWSSIMSHEGSVAHLEFLNEDEKKVFKTAFEIDQRWLIEFAADRTEFICQAQSLNLFLPADISKKKLLMLHYMGWKKGLKSFYYCRSKSSQRADKVSLNNNQQQLEIKLTPKEDDTDKYDECLSCQ